MSKKALCYLARTVLTLGPENTPVLAVSHRNHTNGYQIPVTTTHYQ